MQQNSMRTYSTFVYEIEDRFMADCSMLNLVSSGVTAEEAIENLRNEIGNCFKNSKILLNPVFERR